MLIAIDTGGTFTDCVYLVNGQPRVLKVFSTPDDPSRAVIRALEQIAADPEIKQQSDIRFDVRHGTTVGTNAMLERKGARVAFVTTAGFEDTIAIGRQTRAKLYDWFAPVPVCLAERDLRFGVDERVTAEGKILRCPDSKELEELSERIRASGAQSIAISTLFAFANPKNEFEIESALRELNLPISTSHRILPEFREYERASTIVVNAYLAPRMRTYLLELQHQVTTRFPAGSVDVMQSSGGIVPVQLAAEEPVRTLLSGPAGGVVGASRLAQWAGFDRIIGFDMGGTSTDVFLSDSSLGGTQLTRESLVAGVPVSVPMLDIHTVGAGGGSIARWDAGGMLRVGPESAGAQPGPACFGRGLLPTVTDANLVLGRLHPQSFLDGGVTLDIQRTQQILSQHKGPLASVEEFAAGVLRVVETQMEKAIRVISMERGFDPREFTLVAFGGGGPLHACSLARALKIPTVLVPMMPGALSAMGILLADGVRDYSRTVMLPGEQITHFSSVFAQLQDRFECDPNAVLHHSVDIRYRKQAYELNVPFDPVSPEKSITAFHQQHQQRYGFHDASRPVEIVNARLRVVKAGERFVAAFSDPIETGLCDPHWTEHEMILDGKRIPSRIYQRQTLQPGHRIPGPAMIVEYTSSTLIPTGCIACVDGYRNLVISIQERA